jgi:DNA-binding NtrC family response regulator
MRVASDPIGKQDHGMKNGSAPVIEILTVGQSPRDQLALSECFRSSRWRLTGAAGVTSGLEMLSGNRIDVVISDICLPDGVWSDLRRSQSSGHRLPPIVVASDSMDARLWADALSRGAYDVLVKPYSTEEVLYVVRNACLSGTADRDNAHVERCLR